jgi:DNA end-binding protein Ku
VAVARFVLRNRESLAALRPMDGVLTMATMRFADEVVSPEEISDAFEAPDSEPAKRELDMAKTLIDSLTSDFDADKYRDEYREELLALIERKAKGEEIVAAETEAPEPTKAPDLMAALEESLAAVKGEDLAKGDGDSPKRSPSRSKAKSSAKSSGSKSSSKSKSSSRSRSKAKAAK